MEEAYMQKITNEHYDMDVFIDPYNKRLRIEDYRGDLHKIIDKALDISTHYNAEKLIFICRREHFSILIERAFQCEAMIDYFYRGSAAYYFTKYFSIDRKKSDDWLVEDGIINNVSKLARNKMKQPIPSGYELRKIVENDAEQLAKLYQEVFRVYPTPLHEPEYIKKSIKKGTIYYGFFRDGSIVSAASAEVNTHYNNAELTDCATVPHYRKFGFMKFLLEKLEEELRKQGVFSTYSIARAQSFGMNAALYQLGYSYRGRLLNNCYIFENLENMNMWVKDLSKG